MFYSIITIRRGDTYSTDRTPSLNKLERVFQISNHHLISGTGAKGDRTHTLVC